MRTSTRVQVTGRQAGHRPAQGFERAAHVPCRGVSRHHHRGGQRGHQQQQALCVGARGRRGVGGGRERGLRGARYRHPDHDVAEALAVALEDHQAFRGPAAGAHQAVLAGEHRGVHLRGGRGVAQIERHELGQGLPVAVTPVGLAAREHQHLRWIGLRCTQHRAVQDLALGIEAGRQFEQGKGRTQIDVEPGQAEKTAVRREQRQGRVDEQGAGAGVAMRPVPAEAGARAGPRTMAAARIDPGGLPPWPGQEALRPFSSTT